MAQKFNYFLYLKLIFLICILTGGALIINLWLFYQPSLVEIDLAQFLQFGRPHWLTSSMKLISDSYIALGLIMGFICLWSLRQRMYGLALTVTASLASLLFIDPLKSVFQRPRPIPEFPIIDSIAGTSFPSGHAFTATVLAGTLCLIYIVSFRGKNPFISMILAGIYIIMVAWSRVYLQVHYPSDVLGGIVFGLMVVAGIGSLYRILIRRGL